MSNTDTLMPTVNFSVPQEVRDAFDAEFAGQNKSAIIAALMREAVDRAERRRRSHAAIERLLQRHGSAPVREAGELQRARRKGRI